jgi:hypothetical protein
MAPLVSLTLTKASPFSEGEHSHVTSATGVNVVNNHRLGQGIRFEVSMQSAPLVVIDLTSTSYRARSSPPAYGTGT